jgi:dTDP-4-dehydrorhamnose 3,5-epimerase
VSKKLNSTPLLFPVAGLRTHPRAIPPPRVLSPAVANVAPSELIADVWIVEPEGHGDSRGRFYETYRRSWFPLGREMVQGNRSDKAAGAVVGLHYHLHQADYWQCARGTARVILHDLRLGSPTESATETLQISEGDCRGVFIPPGVAHGFASVTDVTITYLVDSYYNPDDELGVAWDDPEIGADWGVANPILSARDKANPRRADLDPSRRPYTSMRR